MVDTNANPYALAALATAAVPGLDLTSVAMSHIGADFSYATAQDATKRRWVIRIPHNKAAADGQEAEVKLLRLLEGAAGGGALPFEVVRPRGFAVAPTGMAVMVYPEPPGTQLVIELLDPGPGLAAGLGRALAAFHTLPPELPRKAGQPVLTPDTYRGNLRKEVGRAAASGHVTERLVDRWQARLDDDDMWVFTPVVIHGDMAPEHVQVEAGRVTALLDLAAVRVSDPAEDLAPLLAATAPDVAESVIASYRRHRLDLEDPHLEGRAGFLAEIAVVRWLLHGLDASEADIVEDARSMLADLDQAVAAEDAEAEHQAALAEDNRQRLEAAKRASAAAAREHQRLTSESIPKVGEALAETETVRLDRPKRWQEPDTSDDGPRPGGPTRLPVTAGGVDMWGNTGSQIPAWGDELADIAPVAEPAQVPGDEPGAEPKSGFKSRFGTITKPALDQDEASEPGGEPGAEPKPGFKSRFGSITKPALDQDEASEPGPEFEPKAGFKSRFGSITKPAPDQDEASEPGDEPGAEPKSGFKSRFGSIAQPRPAFGSRLGSAAKPGPEPEPEPELESAAEDLESAQSNLPDFLRDQAEAPADLPDDDAQTGQDKN
ncbi:MAG: phosphotransferase [Micrococcales bacterium]|nr:phosphotransferase [Micrococcales bacterium]